MDELLKEDVGLEWFMGFSNISVALSDFFEVAYVSYLHVCYKMMKLGFESDWDVNSFCYKTESGKQSHFDIKGNT